MSIEYWLSEYRVLAQKVASNGSVSIEHWLREFARVQVQSIEYWLSEY